MGAKVEQEPAGGVSLADKLDRLFQTVHSPRGREYTYDEVAAGIREQGGPSISSAYIWELRTGRTDNPRKQHLEALAKFFDVSPAYFFDDESATLLHAQLGLLAAMRDAKIRGIATRAATLSPQALDAIAEMVRRLQQIEGVDEAEGAATSSEFSHGTTTDEAPKATVREERP